MPEEPSEAELARRDRILRISNENYPAAVLLREHRPAAIGSHGSVAGIPGTASLLMAQSDAMTHERI